MTWVVVFAVKSTSHLDLSDGVFLLVIGGLAMSAPIQSGLGAFHFIVSRALVVVYGISLEDGLVYAILSHESQLIFGAILGTYSFYALIRKNPQPPKGGLGANRAQFKAPVRGVGGHNKSQKINKWLNPKSVFVCQNCGVESAKWIGRCPSCKEWNTYHEEIIAPASTRETSFRMDQEGKNPSFLII